MKEKGLTVYYGIIMAIYSMGFVTISAFSSVYLLEIGLSSELIGIVLAIGTTIAVLFEPITGILIDRNPKVSSKKVILLLGFLIFTDGIVLIFAPFTTTIKTIVFGVSVMFLMLAQPILNSLGMDTINSGINLNLGVSRSMGSMGYALGSYAFGAITAKIGPKSIPVAFSTLFFLLCLVLYFYPVSNETKNLEIPKEKASIIGFFRQYKRLGVLLFGMIFIYFSHALINTFALQIVTPKGGNSASMGTASAIAAICELITTFFFTFYMKRIRLDIILKISGVFFILKTLFSLLTKSVIGFYLIQGFQMFGWGFMAIGIVIYVNEIVSSYDKAQGQAYLGMSFTIASVLGSLLGGSIIDRFGVDKMLIVGTISATIGTLFIIIFANDLKSNKSKMY